MPQLRQFTTPMGVLACDANDEIVRKEYEYRGGWELPLTMRIREMLHNGGTLIDVGAHVGLVAVPAALAHPGVVVHAFEPDPRNFHLLKYNAEQNKVESQFRYHNLAVSERAEELYFAPSTDNTVDGRLGHQAPGLYGEEKRKEELVHSTSLNLALRGSADAMPRPWVLKLDVQGAECAALRGWKGLQQPDALFVEVWPYGLHRAGETPKSLYVLLDEYTYGAPLFLRGRATATAPLRGIGTSSCLPRAGFRGWTRPPGAPPHDPLGPPRLRLLRPGANPMICFSGCYIRQFRLGCTPDGGSTPEGDSTWTDSWCRLGRAAGVCSLGWGGAC